MDTTNLPRSREEYVTKNGLPLITHGYDNAILALKKLLLLRDARGGRRRDGSMSIEYKHCRCVHTDRAITLITFPDHWTRDAFQSEPEIAKLIEQAKEVL